MTAPLAGLLLERGAGLADGAQAALPRAQGGGQLVTPGILPVELVLGAVDGLGLFQDAGDLGLERSLALVHAPVAHGLVPGSTGLHLGAIERDPPKLHEARLLAEQQDVEEESMEGLEVPAPELADGLVAGAGLAREEHEVDIAPQACLELARAAHPDRVAVEETFNIIAGSSGACLSARRGQARKGARSRSSTRSLMNAARPSGATQSRMLGGISRSVSWS